MGIISFTEKNKIGICSILGRIRIHYSRKRIRGSESTSKRRGSETQL